jgi:prepilin-type N-terminal cleavage/methylation domain-containing protein
MLIRRTKSNRQGFTLVEMMVGLTLLGVFMTGIFSSVRLSTIIAETSIYETTARNVASGYLEQIKSLPYEEVLIAAQDPANYELKTITPSYDAQHNAQILIENISLDASNQPFERAIVVDVRQNSGTVIEMPMKLWVTVTDRNVGANPINALEVKIVYQYKLPDVIGGNWIQKSVQAIRARLE